MKNDSLQKRAGPKLGQEMQASPNISRVETNPDGLKGCSSSIKSPKKIDKRISRPPLPKGKRGRGKSNHSPLKSRAKKAASSRTVTSPSRSMASNSSQLPSNEVGTQPRYHQVSLAGSNAQHSNRSEYLRHDFSLLYDSFENQNKPESPDEKFGFCFTKENEPVMRRLMQEVQLDLEKDIGILQGFVVPNEGTQQSNGSGKCRSSTEREPDGPTRKEGNQERQVPGTELISVPNALGTFGNSSTSQPNEAFAYNHRHFPSPGQAPGNQRSGIQQRTQMNMQPGIAFSYTFPQSIIPSVIPHVGPQGASTTANYPAWNPIMPNQGQIYRLQEPARGLEGGSLVTYQPSMSAIPRTMGGPITLLNPIQPQHAFFQHPGHVNLFRSNSNNNIGPSPTWNSTANQLGRQSFTAQGVVSHDQNVLGSAASNSCLQPNTNLGQTNDIQNSANDMPQTGSRSSAGKNRRGNNSSRVGVSSKKVKGKRTKVNPAEPMPAASQDMHVTTQNVRENERVGSGTRRRPKPNKKPRTSKSAKTKNGGTVGTSGKTKHQNHQVNNGHVQNDQSENGRGTVSVRQPMYGTVRQDPNNLGGNVGRAETQIDQIQTLSTAASCGWFLTHQPHSNMTVPLSNDQVLHENATGTKKIHVKRDAPPTKSHHISEHVAGNVPPRNETCIEQKAKSNTQVKSEHEENMNKPFQEATGLGELETQAVSGFKSQCGNPQNLRHVALYMCWDGNEIQQSSLPNIATSSIPVGNNMANNQLRKPRAEDGNEEVRGAAFDLTESATRGGTATRTRTQISTLTEIIPPSNVQIQGQNAANASSVVTNYMPRSRSNGYAEMMPHSVCEPSLMTNCKQSNVNTGHAISPGHKSDLHLLLDPVPPAGFYAGNQSLASSVPITAGNAQQSQSYILNTAQIQGTPNVPSVPNITGTVQTDGSAPIGRSRLSTQTSLGNAHRQVDGLILGRNNNEELESSTIWDPISNEEF